MERRQRVWTPLAFFKKDSDHVSPIKNDWPLRNFPSKMKFFRFWKRDFFGCYTESSQKYKKWLSISIFAHSYQFSSGLAPRRCLLRNCYFRHLESNIDLARFSLMKARITSCWRNVYKCSYGNPITLRLYTHRNKLTLRITSPLLTGSVDRAERRPRFPSFVWDLLLDFTTIAPVFL